jgi:transposase
MNASCHLCQQNGLQVCRLGKTPTETYEMLQTVYGDEALSRSSVLEWFKRFRDGREDLQDGPNSGRPSNSRNADTIANVREMVTRGSRLTLRMMSDELNVNKGRFIKSSMKIYGRGRSAQSSSHSLTDEQKHLRFTSCRDFIQTCQDNPSFLDCIVAGDESWVFQYDPEMKCQSMQWTSKSSPRPRSFLFKRPRSKLCWSHFLTKGVIHNGFVPEGQTVNSEVIGRLLKRISRVIPQFRLEGSWFLLHDNAPSHFALVVKIFLAKRCCGDKLPTLFSWSRTSGCFSLSYGESCPQRKEDLGYWRH